jgi:hypothetical protein
VTRKCAVVVAQLAAADICELAQALQRDHRADALDMCERPIRIAARLVASRL